MNLLPLTGMIWTALPASPLDFEQSSISLHIIERLGARLILVAALAIFMSNFCSVRQLYTDSGDMIMSHQG